MHASPPINVPALIAGFAYLAAALAVVVLARRHGIGRSNFVVALTAFLSLHGFVAFVMFGGRYVNLGPDGFHRTMLVLDASSTLLLGWLVIRAGGLAGRVHSALDLSRARATEYDRARDDYDALMRHRIANPLTVMTGGVEVLLAHDNLDVTARRELLSAMGAAATTLKNVSTSPRSLGVEEEVLRPVPTHPATMSSRSAMSAA